jgi:sulfite reductase alpha subunit-like flavoprotein
LKFTSFGLGDSSYPQFNWAHKKLTNRLLQLGAQVICDRADSDEQHPEGIDGSFIPWLTQLRLRLLEQYPLSDGVEAIPDDVLLEPKWILQKAEGTKADVSDSSDRSPNGLLLGLPKSITATIASNQRVTPTTHWQDVRHLSLRLNEQHEYGPGDILTIYPKNFQSDIDQFLGICGWASTADEELMFIPTNKVQYDNNPTSYPSAPLPLLQNARFTLRDLLTTHLDIMSIPRRSFFSHLVHYTSDEFHIERLKEFTNPEFIDELFDYTTRPRRSILEVLDEFTSVKIPWQKVCSIIPIMRGRQFSIASGGDLKLNAQLNSDSDKPTTVELLIAIVKYRTIIKRIRQGVCTRYIATLAPGRQITVTLQKGGLNLKQADMERPVIMVGPGTGVAPMRSLIYERMKWRREHEKIGQAGAEDVLFFGCRNAEADYFFEDEWKRLGEDDVLKTFTAFSRDQRQKVYVQDLVRQQSSIVFRALAEKGGTVYVCGASGKMPQAVRESLIEVFQTAGKMERQDAEVYFMKMEKEGRYKQETW